MGILVDIEIVVNIQNIMCMQTCFTKKSEQKLGFYAISFNYIYIQSAGLVGHS